jgi:3-methyladenine DNA glycosylase AlkD
MISNLSQQIHLVLSENGNPEKAHAMQAYMKNLFPFFGISSPQRKDLATVLSQSFKINSLDKNLMNDLWRKNEREHQYLAMDFMKKYKKQLLPADIDWIESLIIQKSWWDTVDFLATHLVGYIVSQQPSLIETHINHWSTDKNMWLNRTAILFQLKYKEKTDFELLKRYILQHLESKEFFINKASGWALREYAKTNPADVIHFVETQPKLSGLTKREALKHQI